MMDQAAYTVNIKPAYLWANWAGITVFKQEVQPPTLAVDTLITELYDYPAAIQHSQYFSLNTTNAVVGIEWTTVSSLRKEW